MNLDTPKASTNFDGREALARAVGDVDLFGVELWDQRPQHLKAADRRGFEDLLSLDDVDSIISTSGVRLPAFRLVKDGETLPPSRYTKTTRTGSQQVTGVINARKAFDEFADGATIVLQSMHRYWGPLADYCRELELALGHPVQANAYVTPPGAQGFGAHEDPHDVFVLQSHGTKQWQVLDRHDLPPSRPPVIDAVLSPGDSLYIPSGFPHSASTQESASVHITIGILAVTWEAVFKEAVKAVEDELDLKQSLPFRFAVGDDDLDNEVGERLSQISSAVSNLDAGALARKLRHKVLTTRQPLIRGQIHRLLDLDEVDQRTVVTRRGGSICVIEVVGEELSVLMGDRELRMPRRVDPAMSLLASGGKVSVADLPGLDESGRLVLVRRLIREGLIEVAP